MDEELRQEIEAQKRRMAAERRKIQRQLARMGYNTRSPEDAEKLARRLTVKH
jgi:N-acetyl-anhydromuramyl-L-alanine amidase AmpD